MGSKRESTAVINKVFNSLTSEERQVSLIFDEKYILLSARFGGGHIIGYSEDDPNELARTLFAVMVKSMFEKATFVCRLIPVHRLSSDLVHAVVRDVSEDVIASGGKIIALISDNHPINRGFYEQISISDSPWLGFIPMYEQPVALLHDIVYRFKSIRNNWIGERTQTLKLIIN